MTLELNLETVLAIAITFLALNLLFIGFYIVSVLRELKRTVNKAGKVIDDVDRSVQDGMGKAAALEKPLQALATTSVALAGVVKGSNAIRKTTQSILNGSDGEVSVEAREYDKKKPRRPKLFKRKKKAESKKD